MGGQDASQAPPVVTAEAGQDAYRRIEEQRFFRHGKLAVRSSKVDMVYAEEVDGLWCVYIKVEGERHLLSNFQAEDEAEEMVGNVLKEL